MRQDSEKSAAAGKGRRAARKGDPAAPDSLARVERWFQDEMVRSHERPRRARRKTAPEAADVVRPSQTLTSAERVAIYARGYFCRLHDVLAEDFRTIFALLEPEEFQRLARLYLTRFPSRHYSLNQLGHSLPRFLAGPVRVPRRALLKDVARVEWAISTVFDAAETPALTPEDLTEVAEEAWAQAAFETIAAFELLALEHPVNALVSAARQGKPLPAVRRAKAWTVVYRKTYVVWRMDLAEPQFVLLRSLAEGKTMLRALRAAARVWKGAADDLEQRVFVWFQEFVGEGLFSAVELADGTRVAARDDSASSGEDGKRRPPPSTFSTVADDYRSRQISEAPAASPPPS